MTTKKQEKERKCKIGNKKRGKKVNAKIPNTTSSRTVYLRLGNILFAAGTALSMCANWTLLLRR